MLMHERVQLPGRQEQGVFLEEIAAVVELVGVLWKGWGRQSY